MTALAAQLPAAATLSSLAFASLILLDSLVPVVATGPLTSAAAALAANGSGVAAPPLPMSRPPTPTRP